MRIARHPRVLVNPDAGIAGGLVGLGALFLGVGGFVLLGLLGGGSGVGGLPSCVLFGPSGGSGSLASGFGGLGHVVGLARREIV